jgi:hypothetical protein
MCMLSGLTLVEVQDPTSGNPCYMSVINVHAACLYCMSMLHVRAACSCCMSVLHVHAACPCCMSMLRVRAACPCYMSVLHVHALLMPILHVHNARPCCMSLLHFHAACPCNMFMQHVHHACPCCKSFCGMSLLHFLPLPRVQVPPPCGRREQAPQSALQGGQAAIGARLALWGTRLVRREPRLH